MSGYPDSAALLRGALQQSWRNDQRLRSRLLPWRWCVWWITRYGSCLAAAALVSASSPSILDEASKVLSPESLNLILSHQLQINPPTKP
jgi:hypothetical protein